MHEYTKYFKERHTFDRFINLIYKKYKSLGTFSGTIRLANLTPQEAISFSRLFGVTYQTNDTLTISIPKFIKLMENSKYTDFQIEVLVSEYLGVDLTTNREDKEKNISQEQKFYQNLTTKPSLGATWLIKLTTQKIPPYNLIHKRYLTNKQTLKKDLEIIIKLINNLPPKKTFLSIYSSTYTSDPHYLDIDTKNSNLFLYALADLKGTTYPNTREDKIRLLESSNLEIDILSNYVLTYNLISEKNYINQFAKANQTLILNIQNILDCTTFDTKTKKVFVFENPSLLTEIITKNIQASVIISGGFPNTSVYLLLDNLIKNNNTIYYNGDIDPEGLLIAQKLKEKYSHKLNLINYHPTDYYQGISQNKVNLPRLNKLTKVTNDELQTVKFNLLENKYASYQEGNKDNIIKTVINILKQ